MSHPQRWLLLYNSSLLAVNMVISVFWLCILPCTISFSIQSLVKLFIHSEAGTIGGGSFVRERLLRGGFYQHPPKWCIS